MSSIRPQQSIDPDVGIPDLIRRLTDDSRRLASDEVRLAKLELSNSIHTGARGTLWMAVAFGAGVVAIVALTIFMTAAIGRVISYKYWIGALVTGAVELGIAFVLFKRGIGAFAQPSYSMAETRASLKDTTAWTTAQRAD